MADKAITELVAAEQITATDLFVLQQNNTAKKLPAQVFLNWLTAAADGHGGIQSIVKLSTSGLVDTYRITLADTTIFDFVVTNGRAISSITQTEVNGLTRTYTIAFNDGSSETFSVADGRGIQSFLKTSTEGLVDTYTVTYNDGTRDAFTVKNGEKGDKGDNAYIWVKYASQDPTAGSHSFGDVPDAWIGIYWGTESTAPGDWQAYHWYQWKGEKGDKGDPATLLNSNVAYQVGDSGTVIPSGSWRSSVPVVPQGKYLWTRTTNTFNTGDPVVFYSVSRMGLDGSGSVSSVANISPDENGNVPLTASDVDALSSAGGDLTGELRMNGQPIKGLNMPTANDQAANMGYVHQQVKKAAPRNLLDNSDFTNPVNQRGFVSGSEVAADSYFIDRWHATWQGVENPVLNENGISNITYEMQQNVDLSAYVGKPITIALYSDIDTPIYCASGVVANGEVWTGIAWTTNWEVNVCNNNKNFWYFGIRVPCKYAAIYPGEYTAETLPEYQPKGYAAELAACQRYFYQVLAWNILGFGRIDWDGTTISVGVPLGTQMRVIPSVEENITVTITGESLQHNIENIKPEVEMNGNMIKLVYKNVFSDATHANKAVIVYTYDKGMQFSADL